MGTSHLIYIVVLGCIAVMINCDFNFIQSTSDGGYIYELNGNRYKIQEQLHRRYQALDRQSAEQLFLADIQAIQTPSLTNRVGGQSNTNNRRQDAGFLDKNQAPTNDEIASSQHVQSFKPNRPSNSPSNTNIYFPSANAPGQVPTQISSQPLRPNSPQSSRPIASPPLPVHDSEMFPTQNTGFNREIPEERERENNRNPTAAVTNFAWNLFKNSNTLPNYVLSPLSPQILLSYLAYVAEAQTRDELVNVNGFGNPDQMTTLVNTMLSDGGARELQIATAFFVSQEMRLNQQFLDKSVKSADIVTVDFKNSEAAGRTVSRWANSKTKGALKLNKIDYAPSTKIALTSALYFKGKFVYTFPRAHPGLFNAPDRQVQVEMMNMKRKFRWGQMGNYAEWVAIPYESSDSLVIILPNPDRNIDVIIKGMTSGDIDNVMRELDTESSKANVNVTLPKFKIESTTSLIAPLKKMGIESIFSQQAELPYLSDYDKVQVTNAQQQASIDVNEEGTVLVAFTNLNVVALSFQTPVPDVEFNVNRPFIAIIADSKRNIPYCIAKITNPLA